MNIDHLFVHEDEPEVETDGVDFHTFGGAADMDGNNQEYDPKILVETEQDDFSTYGLDGDENVLLGVCADDTDRNPLTCSGLSPLKTDGSRRENSVTASKGPNSQYTKPKPTNR